MVTATLSSERQEGEGQLRGDPKLQISNFLKISIIADFSLKPLLPKHLFHVGAKGAVNVTFFFSLAFKDAKNWTDSSVLVVSPAPCGFYYYYCKALSVSLSYSCSYINPHWS